MPVPAVPVMIFAADVAGNVFQPDGAAAAAGDFAVGDADVAPAEAMHEAAPGRQRNAAAIKSDVDEAYVARAFAGQHRRPAVENQFCGAAHADQLGAVLQPKHPGAIDARRQRQRDLRPRGIVDRALQGFGLIVGAAGPDAILRGVAPERRGQRRRPRGVGGQRNCAGYACGGGSDEMAAIDVHDRVFLRIRSKRVCRIGVTQKCGCAR